MTIETVHPPIAPAPTASRTGRAAITWTTGVVYAGITLLVGFVTTPILLRLLTAERLGAARAGAEWFGYLLLADLGVGAAVGVLLVRARKAGAHEVAAVAKRGLRVLSLIALALMPAGVALAWLLPMLIRIDPALVDELRLFGLISVAGLLLVPLGVFRAVLETAQRGYLVNSALLVQSLLIVGLSVLLAWRGWGLPGLAVAALVGGIVYSAMIARAAVRTLDGFRAAPTAKIARGELWRISWPLAAAGTGNRINLMTDSVVVGFMLGAAPVAVLFLTQRVILLAAAQINALNNATWAALAELLNAGQRDIFASRLAEIARLIVGLGTVFVGAVAAYDARFVRLWVGEPMYGGDALAALTAAAAVVFGFACLFSWVIDMQGDTRHRLGVGLIGALINIILSILFVRQMGLAGVALGTLAAYLLTDAWFCPMLVCRRYGVPARWIVAAAARGLAAGLPFAAAAWWLARQQLAGGGWSGFAIEAGVVGIAGIAYAWYTVLTRAERGAWAARLRGAVMKGSSRLEGSG